MIRSEIEDLTKQLGAFITDEASILVAQFLIAENVKLTITKKRKTKLGDYRPPHGRVAYHRISINGDLNPAMFLLVLIHEFAHLIVYKDHKRNVKPHGEDWKREYRQLYTQYSNCFPESVQPIITDHLSKLKATTCNDPYLTRHLMHMDSDEEIQLLNELQPGDSFEANGRIFQLLKKRRTRFLCMEKHSKKNYLVSGSAVVNRLNK